MWKTKKTITLIIPMLLASLLVSGCTKPAQKQPVVVDNGQNNQANQEEIPEEKISYLESGEVDTSDWKTYRNELYKMEIKYPSFLITTSDSRDEHFTIRSYKKDQILIDKNWDIQFGETLPGFRSLSLEEKKERFRHKEEQSVIFEEISIENGVVYFFVGRSKPGYQAGSQILSKKNILAGGLQLYSEDPNISDFDPKYINVFKAMLKSIKFDD